MASEASLEQREQLAYHHKALSHGPTSTSAKAQSRASDATYQSRSSHTGSRSSSKDSIFTRTSLEAAVVAGGEDHVLW
jgi:hypothetical protein